MGGGTTLAPAALHWQWHRILDGFENRTLRQCIFTSVGGNAVRIRISNRYGKNPLSIGKAALGAKRKGIGNDAELIAQAVAPVTFAGKRAVNIPAGQEITSDPVHAKVLPHQTLAIDLYFPENVAAPEFGNTLGLSYRAEGDRVGLPETTGFVNVAADGALSSYQYLIGVDVQNPHVRDVIVCGADSLSMLPATYGFVQWPQLLSRRLRAEYGEQAPSVVQTLMSGNRLLTSGPSGPSVLDRFERDFLAQPGATKIILFAGFNDLAYPNFGDKAWTGPRPTRSAEEMIAGYFKAVVLAHARGIDTYGCTITPGMDAGEEAASPNPIPTDNRIFDHIWSAESEATRLKVNAWFRASGRRVFDGIFDFAAAHENPLDATYSELSCCGDGVHPNAGGHYAMAQSIDLKALMAGMRKQGAAL